MGRFDGVTLAVLILSLIVLSGCQDLIPHDVPSLLDPNIKRSEIVGLLAGFGTTFAAVPDLITMLKRRSSAGHEPKAGRNHGCLSDPLGLLRVVDCFAAGGHLERGRGAH